MLGKGVRRFIFAFNKIDLSFDLSIFESAVEKIRNFIKKVELDKLYEDIRISFTAISGKIITH